MQIQWNGAKLRWFFDSDAISLSLLKCKTVWLIVFRRLIWHLNAFFPLQHVNNQTKNIFTNCVCFLLKHEKKLKTKKCQRDTKRQLLCCIKYRFLTYLIITRSNISSSYDGGMRWDETWEKRERKTLCNGVFVSVCEQRDAIWSLLVERMFARNTSMRVSVCVYLQWLIRAVHIT